MREIQTLNFRAAELIINHVIGHVGRIITVVKRGGDLIHTALLIRRKRLNWPSSLPVKSVTIAINDLFEFEGQPVPALRPDDSVVQLMARRQFEFLRLPVQIEIGDRTVTVSFSEESADAQAEAQKLADRAGKRAAEGNYEKAIALWKRVLEIYPSMHRARRDLAMAAMETGDIEGAKNHLIEVLRLNPTDSWGWVVLGNLYAKNPEELPTAEKFLRRALELSPGDAWALNGVAAITAQRGKMDEAIQLFEQAVAANPALPNPYYGLGVTYQRAGRLEESIAALERLFQNAKMQDSRSQFVFEPGRQLYGDVQGALVEKEHSDAFKAVENFRAEQEGLSGYPVQLTEGEFKDKTSATIQMAWKHGRDHHLIKFRTGLREELCTHQMAHELTHLNLEAEARKAGKNKFFVTTGKSEQSALQRMEADLQKLQRKGYPADAAKGLVVALIRGLAGFLYNCPLDLLIETRLRERMPAIAATQFIALKMGAQEAWESQTIPEILEVTPRLILRAGMALNGANALFLDHLYRGACNYTANYQRGESFSLSQKLFQHWQKRLPHLGPGDEYLLVDEFAEMLGLRGWYEWKTDPGTHQITGTQTKEGTSNAALLEQKNPAAVWHFLDVLKRYDTLPVETIRDIAYEVAMVGRNGLDYASPDSKYTLKSLPNETFTGLQLMCLMFAGFKRISPEHDLRMDLEEPFLTALEMFQQKDDAGAGDN
jgi:tetratricopeptide (TPR) repeat protein